MAYKFLSDDWFAEVKKIREEAGDIEIPQQMADLVLNLTLTGGPDGDKDICLKGSDFEQGHDSSATTTITIPYDMAKKLFLENDKAVGMQAFMTGQLKIKGDMSKMMALQSVNPSADQEKMREKILGITE
ncbi:MAG: SCP2 sterol-binding domain-containing protein [Bacteroidetes bacterium]|nr:SCP2 sterol-binding domain-containing protein [Bacteroidota bacterium]